MNRNSDTPQLTVSFFGPFEIFVAKQSAINLLLRRSQWNTLSKSLGWLRWLLCARLHLDQGSFLLLLLLLPLLESVYLVVSSESLIFDWLHPPKKTQVRKENKDVVSFTIKELLFWPWGWLIGITRMLMHWLPNEEWYIKRMSKQRRRFI